MKRSLLYVVLIFISFPTQLFATHAFGADLTYKYIGNFSYEITYTYYHQCNLSIWPDSTVYISASSTCGTGGNIQLGLISMPEQLLPNCPLMSPACDGTSFGIQKWVYKGIIDSIFPCGEWIFYSFLSSRACGASNILNPCASNFYVEAKLYNSNLNNNSPVFNNDPLFVSHIFEPTIIHPDVSDIDGDSIVCTLIAPKISSNDNVTYAPGFSATTPISSVPTVICDQYSGNVYFTPVNPEVDQIAELVKEYRNGFLIGEVERDYTHYVIYSNNNTPKLSGIDLTPYYSISICAEQQTCFSIYSEDTNATDTTRLKLISGIPNSTFNILPGIRESGNFCWTPTISDTSSIPYVLTVRVKDDHCDYNAESYVNYNVFVRPLDTTCAISSNNSPNYQEFLQLFPQPAIDHINIFIPEKLNGNGNSFEIRNVIGEIIYSSKIISNENKLNLNLSLKSGIYFILILKESGENIAGKKFIVQR